MPFFFRLSVVLLSLGLASCTCGRAPVQNTLKPDGKACAEDEECESSLCDKLPGKEKVCFKKCAAGCKAGDLCSALAVNDRFACVPEVPGLCQPCALNVDCPYPGDRCLEIGGTKVCARDCSFDGQCPTSYRCADGTDTNGAYVTKQCQPTSGTCECVAASAGQTQPCSETNSFGACNGVRTCRPPNGYEACTAPVPTTESCNGRDDDCNGMTDENLGDTTCGTGECRRNVTNCINGAPQQCEPGLPGIEICDEKDNDCDSVIDEGFDKLTSLNNCGSCGTVCARPNAMPVCMGGMCSIGACNPGFINADGIDANGCELMCTPTGAEICDGTDNDCDGFVDEGFTLASDPTNCGVCGRVCNVNNGNIQTYACVATQCGIMTCRAGFADCDQSYGSGCERNVSSDINNCGNCNEVCTTPNATPVCASSACGIGSCNAGYSDCDTAVATGCEVQTSTNVDKCGTCTNACPRRDNAARTCVAGGCGFTCNPGFVNLDGNAANGCEYTCVAMGVDDPDDSSTDQNCDGIDGDVSRAIFVSLTGNDLNPGTRQQPKRTIQAGISAASTTQPHVYISAGFYDEPVALRSGVSIYGGYAPTTWVRGPASVVTLRNGLINSGRIVAVSGVGITAPSTVAYVTIRALDTTAAGVSTYGLHCEDCPALTVRSSLIIAGSAGAGGNGSSTVAGASGSGGFNGNGGSCDSSAGSGGTAGTSSCGRNGGAGGFGGQEGRNTGTNGGTGVVGTPGGGGGGGGGDGCNLACGSCNAGRRGGDGFNGTSGASGSNGGGGNGGVVLASFWVGSSGGNGANGLHGNGGGGGGGGGGQGGGCVNDGGGNGGGGGGAGGCGGGGGLGGGAGGGSFGVFLVNSNGIRFENAEISSGNGGSGGVGAPGAGGGSGGGRGFGANTCTGEVGGGGNGGLGGDGGGGGHGGGGEGGLSYGIYRVNTAPTLIGGFISPGNAGNGGFSPGASGSTGTSGTMN